MTKQEIFLLIIGFIGASLTVTLAWILTIREEALVKGLPPYLGDQMDADEETRTIIVKLTDADGVVRLFARKKG